LHSQYILFNGTSEHHHTAILSSADAAVFVKHF